MADNQLCQQPRSEVDTTSPFPSVKAAVSLFDEKVKVKKFRSLEKHINRGSEVQGLREELANVKLQLRDVANEKERAFAKLRDSQKLLEEMSKVPCSIDTAIQIERVLGCKEGEELKKLGALQQEHGVWETESKHAWQKHRAAMTELASTKRDLEKVHDELVLSLGEKEDAILSGQHNVNRACLEANIESTACNLSNVDPAEYLINAQMVNSWKQDISKLESDLVLATEELSRLRQELATAEESREKIVRDASEAVASLDLAKMKLEKTRSVACTAGISDNALFSDLDMEKRDLDKALDNATALQSTTDALQGELEAMRRELTALKEREANATAAVETLRSELCKTKSELGAQIIADQVKAAMATANNKLEAAIKASEIAQANEHAAFARFVDIYDQACIESAPEADASSITCSKETPRKSTVDEAENFTTMGMNKSVDVDNLNQRHVFEDDIGKTKSKMTHASQVENMEETSEAELESRMSWTRERDSIDTSTWSDTEDDTQKEQRISAIQREFRETQKGSLNCIQSAESTAQMMFDRKKKKKQHLLSSLSILLRKKTQITLT